jgi:hypothetical protein
MPAMPVHDSAAGYHQRSKCIALVCVIKVDCEMTEVIQPAVTVWESLMWEMEV